MSKNPKQMNDDEFGEWVESPAGRTAIKAQYEQHRRKAALKKGRAYEMLEAVVAMNVPVSIRLPAADIAKAKTIAERKGVGYQTYIKMLLHEALSKEAG
jgi:predicted DNA binding CopG/RHH family protein